jgi:hypothetical protein
MSRNVRELFWEISSGRRLMGQHGTGDLLSVSWAADAQHTGAGHSFRLQTTHPFPNIRKIPSTTHFQKPNFSEFTTPCAVRVSCNSLFLLRFHQNVLCRYTS